MVAHLLPGGAPVGAAIKSFRIGARFNDGIHDVGIDRGDVHADPPHIASGQPRSELVPRFTAVDRLVDGCFRTAPDLGEDMPSALLRRSIKHIGIARIEDHVVHPGIFTDLQDLFPGLSPVGRLVQPAVTARTPDRTFCGHIDHVGIPGIDQHFPDLPRVFQPHVLPALSPVDALINAIPVAERPLVVVFARTHPHHVGVVRIDHHTGDGINPVIIEYRLERGAVVHGLPYMAGSHRYKPFAVVGRIDCEIGNAPGCKCRSDAAEFQSAYQ